MGRRSSSGMAERGSEGYTAWLSERMLLKRWQGAGVMCKALWLLVELAPNDDSSQRFAMRVNRRHVGFLGRRVQA